MSLPFVVYDVMVLRHEFVQLDPGTTWRVNTFDEPSVTSNSVIACRLCNIGLPFHHDDGVIAPLAKRTTA